MTRFTSVRHVMLVVLVTVALLASGCSWETREVGRADVVVGPTQFARPVVGAPGLIATDQTPAHRTWRAWKYAQGAVFEVAFQAAAGQRVLVTASLVVSTAPTASDPQLVVINMLACHHVGDVPRPSWTTARNVARGGVREVPASLVYEAERAGTHRCAVTIRTGRPRAHEGPVETNMVTVLRESQLTVQAGSSGLSEVFRPQLASPVVGANQWARDFAVLETGSSARLQVVLATYLTSCTSPSGSFDVVVNRNACTSTDSTRQAATVRVVLTMTQTGPGACRTPRTVWQEEMTVEVDVHHRPAVRNLSVGTDPDCGAATLRLSFLGLGPAPMLLHRSGILLRADEQGDAQHP